MSIAGAVLLEQRQVFCRAISLVLLKIIPGYRSCRSRMSWSRVTLARIEAAAMEWLRQSPLMIAFWDGYSREDEVSVDQEMVRRRRDRIEGPFHSDDGGFADIDLVDGPLIDRCRCRKRPLRR